MDRGLGTEVVVLRKKKLDTFKFNWSINNLIVNKTISRMDVRCELNLDHMKIINITNNFKS